jgi:hypothetical protein
VAIWFSERFRICLQTADGEKREFVVLPHGADAIEAWARSLHQRFAGRPVALCLEIAKGPLVYALQKYDFPGAPVSPRRRGVRGRAGVPLPISGPRP